MRKDTSSAINTMSRPGQMLMLNSLSSQNVVNITFVRINCSYETARVYFDALKTH